MRSMPTTAARDEVNRPDGGGRSGGGGVSQEANAQSQREADRLNSGNLMLYAAEGDKSMNETTFVSVRQNADQTLYRRGTRWVDARMLDQAESEPERTIEFASDEYFELVDRFAREHRQSVLAAGGDIYLLRDGKRTLIKQSL